jgi:cytochrome b involved in lipid metabolism
MLLISAVTLFLGGCSLQNTSSNITPTSTQVATKTYTLADVATHAKETDCWLVVEKKVYDVTSFIPNHPGGKAILKGCGVDATVLFEQRPDTDKGPHPESAKTQLEKLYIGDLKQ